MPPIHASKGFPVSVEPQGPGTSELSETQPTLMHALCRAAKTFRNTIASTQLKHRRTKKHTIRTTCTTCSCSLQGSTVRTCRSEDHIVWAWICFCLWLVACYPVALLKGKDWALSEIVHLHLEEKVQQARKIQQKTCPGINLQHPAQA